ncbi:MAG: WYL domain-containing protein [Epsilonproteobacteria bacterium]|nr:WYL domain-containing protein [Campylobacterota bacterium]
MAKLENLIEFLSYVNRNKGFCTKDVAQLFELTPRTIQRYKKELEIHFKIHFYSVGKGCYEIFNPNALEDLFTNPTKSKQLEKVFEILSISLGNNDLLEQFNISPKLKNTLLKKHQEVFKIRGYPFEELEGNKKGLINKLKRAIIYKYYSEITYTPSDHPVVFKQAKPLKIVFAEGNWYLAILTKETLNGGFKFLRINFIENIKLHPQTFQVNYKAKEFIENFQSLFSSFDGEYFEVKVRIDKEISRFFRVKKHLPSQKIIKDEGDLILSYTINNKKEILHLAKKWLPHMRILEPSYLQEELLEMIRSFLNKR